MKIKICRKEAKESKYWLRLIDMSGDSAYEKKRQSLTQEAYELMNIFGSILRNTK